MERKYLYGHIDERTAYVQDDYPWGFRLRTQQRYWIESKKGFGQRLVTQTKNPKTGLWCKPKYCTYAAVVVLYLDDNGHVHREELSQYCQEKELVNEFMGTHKEHLTDFQKLELLELRAVADVMEKVTFEVVKCPVGPVSLLSRDPEDIEKRKEIEAWQENRRKEREKDAIAISHAINVRKRQLTG